MILGLETSCDETAAAIGKLNQVGGVEILGSSLASSVSIQKKFGGIIPESAAREQLKAVLPVIDDCFEQSANKLGCSQKQLLNQLTALAVTNRPGLMTSLLVGVETMKTLAWLWDKPLIPINHLDGHIYSAWLESVPQLPALALIVSGGHTQLVWVDPDHQQRLIGQTKDDAAGECFDKSARLLGLDYPGGQQLSQLASQYKGEYQPKLLPSPLLHQPENEFDFSFSGLKTAVAAKVKQLGELDDEQKKLIAFHTQAAIVKSLTRTTQRAIQTHQPRSLILGGGVAANDLLKTKLAQLCTDQHINFFSPSPANCTDNASMIVAAALVSGQKPEPIDKTGAQPKVHYE